MPCPCKGPAHMCAGRAHVTEEDYSKDRSGPRPGQHNYFLVQLFLRCGCEPWGHDVPARGQISLDFGLTFRPFHIRIPA